MNVEQSVTPIRHHHQAWLRLAVGIPILAGVFLTLALVGWGSLGFRADLAPRHWMHDVLVLPGLIFYGGLASVLGGSVLWVLGWISFTLGDGVISQWRDVRRRPG